MLSKSSLHLEEFTCDFTLHQITEQDEYVFNQTCFKDYTTDEPLAKFNNIMAIIVTVLILFLSLITLIKVFSKP